MPALTTLVIPTPRLRLRLQSTESVLAQIEAMNAADRAEVSPEWLARMRNGPPTAWTHGFEMVNDATGAVVGSCGYKGPPDPDGTVEIAYEVREEFRGRGYAKEAVAALVDFALDSGARAVRAHTKSSSNASERVLLAFGFESVGEVVDPEDGPVWRWDFRPGMPRVNRSG
jgi:RimJ/RimL family protein N-acetyltransferase